MKQIYTQILAVLLIAGAAFGASALDFTGAALINGVTNTSAWDTGAVYADWACMITGRAGITNVPITLQGTLGPASTDDELWDDLVSSTVVNATAAATDNTTWHFTKFDGPARTVRVQSGSGAGVANTVAGFCVPVSR